MPLLIKIPTNIDINIVTESSFNKELVEKIIKNKRKAIREFLIAIFNNMIDQTLKTRIFLLNWELFKHQEKVFKSKTVEDGQDQLKWSYKKIQPYNFEIWLEEKNHW